MEPVRFLRRCNRLAAGGRTAVGIQRCDPEYEGERFVQGRVGLHHICLRARSREDVDAVGSLLSVAVTVMVPQFEKV